MKRKQTEPAAPVPAGLPAEPEQSDAPAADLSGLVAHLLEAGEGTLPPADLAAYYDGAQAPAEREATQRFLADNPAAVAELIALDEVLAAQAAAGASPGVSPEVAGQREAGKTRPLVARALAAHDGVWTLKPKDVAVSEVLPDEPEPEGLLGRLRAALDALLGR